MMLRAAVSFCLLVPFVTSAAEPTAPTANETRAFMKKLAEYVAENHLKKDEKSPQRGMVYEYFNVARKGQPDQWIQGEALDTMHDGAFFALALATAYKATGDNYYKDLLTKWVLPFYVKVLNHSDELFSPDKDDAGPKAHKFNKEHQLQKGEKGFCPYWWDDGASVSLEQRRSKSRDLFFSGTNNLKGQENPHAKLDGYSHGSSNHLAQDLGIMLQGCWLVIKDSKDETDRKLAEDVALAAKNLHECRIRHHGVIPAVAAAAALTNNDAELMKRIGEMKFGPPSNHYTRLLSSLDDNKRHATPGFMDDAEYHFYSQTAKSGKLTNTVAFKLIYDAYTEPMLIRLWQYACARMPVEKQPLEAFFPAGMNRFDLIGHGGRGGKFDSYDPYKPLPLGSRMGPQSMVVSAWALQAAVQKPSSWGIERQPAAIKQSLWKDFVKRLAGTDVVIPLKGYPNRQEFEFVDVTFRKTKVRLSTTHRELQLRFDEFPKDGFRLYSQPDAKGNYAEVSKVDDYLRAKNASGDQVMLNDYGGFPHRLGIDYTFNEKQTRWANGYAFARLSLRIGDETKNLCLVPDELDLYRALHWQLSAGLRTWMKIFANKGYIPTGIGAGKDWDGLSDTGGYAHLIKAGALYLMWLDGKKDFAD